MKCGVVWRLDHPPESERELTSALEYEVSHNVGPVILIEDADPKLHVVVWYRYGKGIDRIRVCSCTCPESKEFYNLAPTGKGSEEKLTS